MDDSLEEPPAKKVCLEADDGIVDDVDDEDLYGTSTTANANEKLQASPMKPPEPLPSQPFHQTSNDALSPDAVDDEDLYGEDTEPQRNPVNSTNTAASASPREAGSSTMDTEMVEARENPADPSSMPSSMAEDVSTTINVSGATPVQSDNKLHTAEVEMEEVKPAVPNKPSSLEPTMQRTSDSAAEDTSAILEKSDTDSLTKEGAGGEGESSTQQHVAITSPNGLLNAQAAVDASKPADPTNGDAFLEAAKANTDKSEAEFAYDSSPEVSDTSSSASSSGSESSSDSGDDQDDGEESGLLGAREQARILMEGAGGSGDEAEKPDAAAAAAVRSVNEVAAPVYPKPDIEITADMEIVQFGSAVHAIKGELLIESLQSGEKEVLEDGSVVCLEDRTVVGCIAEQLWQVPRPHYLICFADPVEIGKLGIRSETKLFYVKAHSSFILTERLKEMRGTDASNIHDEEVGGDEIEFSDDEAEAAYKRARKEEKMATRGRGRGGRGGTGKASVSSRRNGSYGDNSNGTTNDFSTTAGSGELPYFDDAPSVKYQDTTKIKYEDNSDEDMYTPLARPTQGGPNMPPRPPMRDMRGSSARARGFTNGQYDSNGNRGGYQGSRVSFEGRSRARGHQQRGQGRGRGGRGTHQNQSSDRPQSSSGWDQQSHNPAAHMQQGPSQAWSQYGQHPQNHQQYQQFQQSQSYSSYGQPQPTYPNAYGIPQQQQPQWNPNQNPMMNSAYQQPYMHGMSPTPPFPSQYPTPASPPPFWPNGLPNYQQQPSNDIPAGAFVNPNFVKREPTG
ncbi:MAG: hypothetical protein M1828_003251 [Chrysothrix sp. TS-e1954]|nr:MAG: hypothetical protein M1828_003251 [Chrysothrix sp. TS-e1954]